MMFAFAQLALVAALLAASLGVAAAEPMTASDSSGQETDLTVLCYNVHGLFPLAAKDDPRDRMPTIGWLANRYEVAMFQEDFEYHHVLRSQMPASVSIRGNGMGWDPRRVLAKLLVWPVSLFLPHFSPPYGAGISIFVREPLVIAGDVDRKAFGICRGWFGSDGDCWARKGYQRVGIRMPNGSEIDLYNTHLEAGGNARAVKIRKKQLDVLARAIEARPRTRALIVAGDFNSSLKRPRDRETLLAFRHRLDLRDTGARPELRSWRALDYILYREGTATALRVEQAGEAGEFVDRDRALSDHPALYARFQITPLTSVRGAQR